MGDPDTGRGIPEQEQFSSSAERAEFSRAANFDPNVTRAVEMMEEHSRALENEPESAMDELIDELLAEQKKSEPSATRLADIRQRLDQEHTLVMAQSVTSGTAEQHIADRLKTRELDDSEIAVNEILKIVPMVEGLLSDIRDVADDALGDMAEEYPEEIEDVLEEADGIRNDMYNEILEATHGQVPEVGSIEKLVQDESALKQLDFDALKKIYAHVYKARNELVDEHSVMLKAVSEWRQKHQSQ